MTKNQPCRHVGALVFGFFRGVALDFPPASPETARDLLPSAYPDIARDLRCLATVLRADQPGPGPYAPIRLTNPTLLQLVSGVFFVAHVNELRILKRDGVLRKSCGMQLAWAKKVKSSN